MRIISSIPHPQMSISIFMFNEKYIVKFEAGPMEQSYKFPADKFSSVEDLKTKITDEFIEKIFQRFLEMKEDLKKLSNQS